MWVDILDPYSSHMALPMWVQHGTLLQIPHESLMGCPCRTHINTHLGPMWVLYFLLAGNFDRRVLHKKVMCHVLCIESMHHENTYFRSKHKWWVLVRTALMRRF